MAHQNLPCQQTRTSPAVALFEKPIRYSLSIPNLELWQVWQLPHMLPNERDPTGPLHPPTPSTPSTDTNEDLKTLIQPATPPTELITPRREDSQHPYVLVDSHPIPLLNERPRRSTRTRRPPRPLSSKMTRQTHD